MASKACSKFGHHALNSDLMDGAHNTELVAAVGMLTKKSNCHSKSETISKLTVHFQIFANYFSSEKFMILT